MKRIYFLWPWTVILSVLLATSSSFAEEKRCIDYEQPHKVVSFAKTRIRSKFVRLRIRAELHSPRVALADIRVWLERDGKVTAKVPIEADRSVGLPFIGEETAEDTEVCINQPKDVASIAIDIRVVPPGTKVVRYRELFDLLDDYNNFTEEMAGIVSWFIRDKDVIAFKFAQPATIEILSIKRPRKFSTSDELVVEIERHDDWKDDNPEVRFSALPVALETLD